MPEYIFTTKDELMEIVREAVHCRQWDEMHHSWRNPPRRCIKLFNKVFKFPDGIELVIIRKK